MHKTIEFPRLGYLDGLRGLSCVAVILHHCVFHGARLEYANPALRAIAHILSLGYTGVEVFFILSGFCLAAPMFLPGYSLHPKIYLLARFRRLYPAYFLTFMMLVVLGVGISLSEMTGLASVFPRPKVTDVIIGLVLYSVWGNTVFWTLVIEARWYPILPFIVGGIKKLEQRGLRWGIASATMLLASAAVAVIYIKGMNATPGILTRAIFAIGMVMAYLPILVSGVILARHRELLQDSLKRHHRVVSILLTLLIAGCLSQLPADPMVITLAKRLLFAGGCSIAIFTLALINPLFQWILQLRLIVHLGKISYTAYLIHLPLIQLFKHILPGTALPQPAAFGIYYIVLPVALLFISHFAAMFLEAPFLRKPHADA